ncbi:DUF6194 family protein [Isoptericola halotolerans]|uniref:DUF6194 family protein n=1 Tax=Isoptericola halotolerans TaxID=300560 RepID=UPI00388F8C85
MSMDQIIETVRGWDGVLVLQPGPGSSAPELAWGDAFFYYAPDGRVPTTVQPYGTIVTKDYPDDTSCDLDRPGRWRVNIHVGRDRAQVLLRDPGPHAAHATGASPSDAVPTDTFVAHPVYGGMGWVCVVNPADRTGPAVVEALREAHDAARQRYERRSSLG